MPNSAENENFWDPKRRLFALFIALKHSSLQCVSLSETRPAVGSRQRIRGVSGAQYAAAQGRYRGAPARGMPFRVRVRSALQSYGSGLDWIDRRAIAIMHRSTDSLGAPLSLLITSVIVAIITIPKKKTSSPIVKEKRKAGTRAGLTKAAIVAAAAFPRAERQHRIGEIADRPLDAARAPPRPPWSGAFLTPFDRTASARPRPRGP